MGRWLRTALKNQKKKITYRQYQKLKTEAKRMGWKIPAWNKKERFNDNSYITKFDPKIQQFHKSASISPAMLDKIRKAARKGNPTGQRRRYEYDSNDEEEVDDLWVDSPSPTPSKKKKKTKKVGQKTTKASSNNKNKPRKKLLPNKNERKARCRVNPSTGLPIRLGGPTDKKLRAGTYRTPKSTRRRRRKKATKARHQNKNKNK